MSGALEAYKKNGRRIATKGALLGLALWFNASSCSFSVIDASSCRFAQ
jgi:hypothetical protein